jgi:Ca2+-binding EF-hand superfamily protein
MKLNPHKLIFYSALLTAGILTTNQSLAQTNGSAVRLAIISESAASAEVADLLTVELSGKSCLQLLERAQIEKVYQEQGISAANRDHLKLGQVLGADGLLLLTPGREGTNQFMEVRLVGVKPGVIIEATRSSWPVRDPSRWARWLANHFDPLFPKLGVLAKDALPISVVNLRSPLRTTEAQETELQLTALLVERLSREREIFVLERRRMELLSAEKELQSLKESAFWNGSYLLEGVVDRDGYTKERISLHGRLVPPNGSPPIELVVDGSRDQPASVVEKLTTKILESLKRGSSMSVWNPEAEAGKYYEEARWALEWNILPQAKAAAESAWALGKHDVDCALVRVRAYLPDISVAPDGIIFGSTLSDPRAVRSVLRDLKAKPALALFTDERYVGRTVQIDHLLVEKLPDPGQLDRALHLLRLYAEFTRHMPADEPRAESPWQNCGADVLARISRVLQYFHLVPDQTKEYSDKLAQLRALARLTADRMMRPPSVTNAYWVGDRIASHDELAHLPPIFRCKVDWGCFWQEKPEDCIAMYRELLASPAFSYIHEGFWLRGLGQPRVTGWTTADQQRGQTLWNKFMDELNASTNFLWRMEAKALEFADARNDDEREAAFEALFQIVFSNRETIVTHNVELPYLAWGTKALVFRDGLATQSRQKLQRSEYFSRMDALSREWRDTLRSRQEERERLARFEKQKECLLAKAPYDPARFRELFFPLQVSSQQAVELAPLLAAYKSNLIAQGEGKTGSEQTRLRQGIAFMGSVEKQLDSMAHPAIRPRPSVAQTPTNSPPLVAVKPGAAIVKAQPTFPVVTNALLVKQFHKIPTDQFKTGKPEISGLEEMIFGVGVNGHRYYDGRLWLNLRYTHHYYVTDGNATTFVDEPVEIAAVWNFKTEMWEFIRYPEAQPPADPSAREYFEICDGGLYAGRWDSLARYDLKTRQWETLAMPWQASTRLFAVSNRLFAVNNEAIIEILDHGKSTKILASCRRRPPASTLDTLRTFGPPPYMSGSWFPKVFPGPNGTIRAHVAERIVTWDGHDWSDVVAGPINRVEPFEDGTLFVDAQSDICLLPHAQTNVEICWRDGWKGASTVKFAQPLPASAKPPKRPQPRWKAILNLQLSRAPALLVQSNIFMYVEHRGETNATGQNSAVEKDSRYMNLILLDRDFNEPLLLPLKFDTTRGPVPNPPPDRGYMPPSDGSADPWMLMTDDVLLIGQHSIPGIWMVPRSDLQTAIAREKALREPVVRQQAIATEQETRALLAKFDWDKNGRIEGAEKEKAILEPAYLASELESIDANQNGLLDPEELSYFDFNNDSQLEPGEEAGIDAYLHLKATGLFGEADKDGDGNLSMSEFMRSTSAEDPRIRFGGRGMDFTRWDKNRDGKLDLKEFESGLKQRTQSLLGAHPPPGRPFVPELRSGNQTTFKEAVEAFWRDGSTTNRSSRSTVKPSNP